MGAEEKHPERVVELHRLLNRVPATAGYDKTIREAIQKECDSDLRAHDALLSRGNTLLTASGVVLGLLVNFARDASARLATPLRILLLFALISATAAVLFTLLGLFVRSNKILNSDDLVGANVPVVGDAASEWSGNYELVLATAYLRIRHEIHAKHEERAGYIQKAQLAYLLLIACICVLIWW